MTRDEYQRRRQISDAEYAQLQAKVVTGAFSRVEYARLWAAARARGEYPPFICKTMPEPEAGS